MIFIVTLCFNRCIVSLWRSRTCPGGCSRVSCESALASVVLSVSSDRLETIRDDLYCDFVFQPMHCFFVAVPDLSRCSLFLTGWRPSATCFILIHRMRNIHLTGLKTSPFDLSRSITPSCHHSSTLFIDSNIRHFPVIVSHITKSWRLGGEVGSLNEEQRRSTKTCTRLTKFNLNKARDG
jgi:hypothetical protein